MASWLLHGSTPKAKPKSKGLHVCHPLFHSLNLIETISKKWEWRVPACLPQYFDDTWWSLFGRKHLFWQIGSSCYSIPSLVGKVPKCLVRLLIWQGSWKGPSDFVTRRVSSFFLNTLSERVLVFYLWTHWCARSGVPPPITLSRHASMFYFQSRYPNMFWYFTSGYVVRTHFDVSPLVMLSEHVPVLACAMILTILSFLLGL